MGSEAIRKMSLTKKQGGRKKNFKIPFPGGAILIAATASA
jgi:hypothetical protein